MGRTRPSAANGAPTRTLGELELRSEKSEVRRTVTDAFSVLLRSTVAFEFFDPQLDPAHTESIAGGEGGGFHALAVDERAVRARQIDDFEPFIGRGEAAVQA